MSVAAGQQTTNVNTAPQLATAQDHPPGSRTFQCLVVSAIRVRREMLASAADQAGWKTVVCAEVDKSWNAAQREVFQLALIDLQDTNGTREELRQLGKQLSQDRHLLLVICGNENDPREELWARQIGAWLYLPGVSDQCNIQQLCAQARPLAEQLATRLNPATGADSVEVEAHR